MNPRKKVVILGAGFGGLRAAKVISKKFISLGLIRLYEVVLIDKNSHHTYTPLLYEVATTSAETATSRALYRIVTYDIRSLVKNLAVTFLQDTIERINLDRGVIELANSKHLEADFILIALGSETNYFSISGLREHSLPFKTFADALRIRDATRESVARAGLPTRVVIGGGGSAGVELAAEFQNLSAHLAALAGPGEKSNVRAFEVTLIEARPNILPDMDREIIKTARERLEKFDVRMITGKKIISANSKQIILENREVVSFDIFIWVGGVKAPALLSYMPIETETGGRAIVGEGMECLPQTPHLKLSSRIYGLGDSVCFYDPITKKAIPGVARAALSQANIAAHNIIEDIKKREGKTYSPRFKTYRPREYPYVVPVGGKYALAKLGPFVVKGFLGWTLKGLVELNYLLSIMRPITALRIWLRGLKIFIQNDRLG